MICEICNKTSKGVIRTHNVCTKHFLIFRKDNLQRWRHNENIPKHLRVSQAVLNYLSYEQMENIVVEK